VHLRAAGRLLGLRPKRLPGIGRARRGRFPRPPSCRTALTVALDGGAAGLRLAWPALRLVSLRVDTEELRRRLATRLEHFFPPSLLDSQLKELEPPQADEAPFVVSGDLETIVRTLVSLLRPPASVRTASRGGASRR